LGIDWGEARIGLALGDSQTKLATPYGVVKAAAEIEAVVKEEDVDVLVVGEPQKMSGILGGYHSAYKEFKKELAKRFDMPIKYVDERLTTKMAGKLIGDKKTKAPEDAIAAMLILQSYLDKNNG